MTASRRRLGITRERWALLENHYGATSVTTLEAPDVDLALAAMFGSNLPFENWFRERLQILHGISLTHYEQYVQPAPPAQPQELLFEWSLPDNLSA